MNNSLRLLYGAVCAGLVLLLSGAGEVRAEAPKMATVDMQKLFKEYHRTITAQKQFNKEYARIQKSVNERAESINRTRRILETLNSALKKTDLKPEERSGKEREKQLISQELQIMDGDLKTFSQTEKLRVARLKAASMQGIMNEIGKRVREHSKEQGYDYVFDKSGKNTNQVSFFLYLKDAKDITANMLKELNKFAPGEEGR